MIMTKRNSFIFLFLLFSPFLMARGKVVVFPFENRSDNSRVEWLSYGLEVLFEDSLGAVSLSDRMDAVDRMDVPDTAGLTLATRVIIARKLGADTLITGNFSISDNIISIEFFCYRIDRLLEKKARCTVSKFGFPADLAPFIRKETGAAYPYPKTFSSHAFEAYVRGMLRAGVNDDFTEIEKLAGKISDCEPLNRNLGNLLYDTGRYKEALLYLKRLPETDTAGLFRSGMCCTVLKKFSDGLIYFLQTLKTRRDTASVVNAAGCLLNLGHPAEASAFLDSLPEKTPVKEPVVLFDRAVVEAAQGKWNFALDVLSRYVAVFRFTDKAKVLAFFCCGRCSGSHPLCADTEDAVSAQKGKPGLLSMYQFCTGGKTDSTVPDLLEIKELYLEKAREALNAGEKDEAIDSLQKILYLDPLQKDALEMLCNRCKDADACKKLKTLTAAKQSGSAEHQ
ncbi:MAG: tetratricopeptide repeat protein [Acidobacteria bacterium]|nr:tetratricopeptide repeat protein [Acidobacteriota bacterium]